VFAGIDREGFSDTVGIGGVVVVPASLQLFQTNRVGLIPIDLVGRHMDKGAGDAGAAGGLKKVEGANCVDVEVVERAGGGEVVAGLGGRVDDCARFEFFDEFKDRGAIPNIEFVMTEGGEGLSEAMLIPTRVSACAKEVGSLVIVDPMDFFAAGSKERNHFRSDQARGAGDEELHTYNLWVRWAGEGKEHFLILGREKGMGPPSSRMGMTFEG